MVLMDTAQVTIDNSSVHNNSAAILQKTNDRILHNGASFAGGLVAVGTSKVVMTNSNMSGNYAQVAGGILAMHNATLELSRCNVHDNQALDGSGGGLLVMDAVMLTITDGCSIANNDCTGGVGGGIAVWMDAGDNLLFGGTGRFEGSATLHAT